MTHKDLDSDFLGLCSTMSGYEFARIQNEFGVM